MDKQGKRYILKFTATPDGTVEYWDGYNWVRDRKAAKPLTYKQAEPSTCNNVCEMEAI